MKTVLMNRLLVLHLGTDVQAVQWKEATGNIFKITTTMHFSIKK